MPPVLSPLRSFKNPSWLSLAHISKSRRYSKCFKTFPDSTTSSISHSLAEDKIFPVLRMAASFVKLPRSLIREPSSIKAFLNIKIRCTFEDSTLNEISPVSHLSTVLPYFFSFSYMPIAFCLYIYIAFILFWF